MSEENEKNQETDEQPEVTQEPQPETPAPEVTPAEEPAQPVEAPAPPPPAAVPVAPQPAPVPVPSPPGAPPAATKDTSNYIIWGWVLVALSFFSCCCGPIFAIPAIILGVIAYSKGDQRGMWIIIAGAVALLLAGGGSFGLWRHTPNWVPNLQHRFPTIPGGRPV